MTHDLTQPITILHGDAITRLRELPAESVQCVVTSPPFYGLRDYQTPPMVWGGEPSCEHVWGPTQRTPWANEAPGPHGRRKNGAASHTKTKTTGPFCQTCGCWRGELGQEVTVSAFIEHLTMVFREVWRVLAPSGTCWVNIADSYAGSGMGPQSATGERASRSWPPPSTPTHPMRAVGLKNKDLCLVPERLSIALQEFGWYVRASVVWAKTAPMPEAVRDRPTRAHEMVYLLAKNERYYYNAAAIAEPAISKKGSGNNFQRPARLKWQNADGTTGTTRGNSQPWEPTATRNTRDVWTLDPEPFPGAHFATMPTELASRCILAGSRPGDTILDPFAGSGTTLMVAQRLERRAIGIELNADYVRMIERRTAQPNLWLASQDCEVGA
jgi:DNA modification methylase